MQMLLKINDILDFKIKSNSLSTNNGKIIFVEILKK